MFKRILVPTDGSDLSAKTVQAAAQFAHDQGSELVIMTAIEDSAPSLGAEFQAAALPALQELIRRDAQERLEQAADIASKAGVAARTVSLSCASPARAIIDAALGEHCDLIIMASHGRHGISAVLLGSETQKVLVQSDIPVLVYR